MEPQERLTKRERRELRRREQKESEQAEHKSKTFRKRRNGVMVIAGIALAAGGIFYITTSSPEYNTASAVLSATDHTKGNPEAAVTIIEYGDFQCPACGSYYPIVKQLEREFGDRVQFAYRHFPLQNIHPYAFFTAVATEAAGKQEKFWEMHDILFENQSSWSNTSGIEEIILGYAESIGVRIEQFKADMQDPALEQKVKNDYEGGLALRVNATPTFFLNGKKIANPQSYEAFKELIDAELANEEIQQSAETEPIHVHADFKLYIENKMIDLSGSEYQSTEDNNLHPTLHFHSNVGHIIHRHAEGVTMGDFFASLGMELTETCITLKNGEQFCNNGDATLKFFVNGKQNNQFQNYVFNDLDQILISYGKDSADVLKTQLESVSDEACIYSELCPERGTPPDEECVGGLGTSCK